jgi:tetratricopeptide (TPR) repeat protein
MTRPFTIAITVLFTLLLLGASWTSAQTIDEVFKAHVPKMREVERYQMNIAQKYFAERNWKVALTEYEKYLTLYERSGAAPYAQLKWSICMASLRQQNTAIKEGYQSVIDYWPDSQEAKWAQYYIGTTYRDIGRIPYAKKALQRLVTEFPKHTAAVYARSALETIAREEGDTASRVKLLKELTYSIMRDKWNSRICQDASRSLASYHFAVGAFDEGVQSIQTTYQKAPACWPQVVSHVRGPIGSLVGKDETRTRGTRLADLAITYVKRQIPADTSEEAALAEARRCFYAVIDLHNQAGRENDVLTGYQAMIKKFGVDDEILGNLAGWYKRRSSYDEARQVYRRFADGINGLAQVASSYREQNEVESAIAVYRQLQGQDREQLVKWKGEEAATYRQFRDFPAAIGLYRELIKLDIANAPAWLWSIGTAQQEAGLHAEAIGTLRQCEDHFPENYQRMASCHRALKQQKEALILYGQIIGGHPASAAWAQLQIGYTYEEMDAKEPAIRAFQAVCKKYPKVGYASTAHAHLQNKYKISVTLGGATDK